MSEPRNDFAPGVMTGNEVKEVFALAKAKGFALPAVNCIGTNSMNAAMETAAELNSPVIIQFSNSGGRVHRRQDDRCRQAPGGDARVDRRRAARARLGRSIRRPGHSAHRSLRQEAAAVDRRSARRRRGAIRRDRQAAVQLAHARSFRGADGGEHRDLEALPRADGEDGHDARDRARHHRRRGGRRRQLRRGRERPLHQARGSGVRLRGADEGQRPVHDRRRVRQRARRVQAGQREAQAVDPARQPGVHPGQVRHGRAPVDFVFHGGSGSSPRRSPRRSATA